jgi:hypothetical protein
MKQSQSNKYSVAWFKIADFVTRGQKERALGLHRLLAHSIGDNALNLQLEGDILLSCNDNRALEKYQAAALYYQKEERLCQALAIYEHILLLRPGCSQTILFLIALYNRSAQYHYAEQYAQLLVYTLAQAKKILLLISLIQEMDFEPERALKEIIMPTVKELLLCSAITREEIMVFAKALIDRLLQPHSVNLTQHFLHELTSINKEWGLYFTQYVASKEKQ